MNGGCHFLREEQQPARVEVKLGVQFKYSVTMEIGEEFKDGALRDTHPPEMANGYSCSFEHRHEK